MSFLSPQALNNLVPINHKDSRAIAFIDSNIVDCEKLVQQVIPTARAIILGSEDDGVGAISRIVNTSNCLEIHIFSSGFPGCIYLGNSELSINTLRSYSPVIKNWFNTNNSTNSSRIGYFNFYSCNLDVGDAGTEFITKLSHITGAKISVSSNFSNENILKNIN